MSDDEMLLKAIVRCIKAGRTAWRRGGQLPPGAEFVFREVVCEGGNNLQVILNDNCARPTKSTWVASLSVRANQVFVSDPSSSGGQHATGDTEGSFLVDLSQCLGLKVLQGVLGLYGIPFSVKPRLTLVGHRSPQVEGGGV